MQASKSIIQLRSFDFAINIIHLYRKLLEHKEFVLSKQMLRSGTSVGALVREAQKSESPADFIHKLAIAQKECDESLSWLELMEKTQIINHNEFENLWSTGNELLKMIKSAIITMKNKRKL